MCMRFQLDLPPISRATTSRYIQIRRNALPRGTTTPPFFSHGVLYHADTNDRLAGSPAFNADPRERLIVLRIATSPVERGEEQFELHVPARALLDHAHGAAENVVFPWSAWCSVVRATPTRRVPYTVQARMIAYGMRVVSHPPDWEEGVLHVDSYLPLAKRREGGTGVGAITTNSESGTHQAIRLPGDAEGKTGLVTVLCEDAVLCYKVCLEDLGVVLLLLHPGHPRIYLTGISFFYYYTA